MKPYVRTKMSILCRVRMLCDERGLRRGDGGLAEAHFTFRVLQFSSQFFFYRSMQPLQSWCPRAPRLLVVSFRFFATDLQNCKGIFLKGLSSAFQFPNLTMVQKPQKYRSVLFSLSHRRFHYQEIESLEMQFSKNYSESITSMRM